MKENVEMDRDVRRARLESVVASARAKLPSANSRLELRKIALDLADAGVRLGFPLYGDCWNPEAEERIVKNRLGAALTTAQFKLAATDPTAAIPIPVVYVSYTDQVSAAPRSKTDSALTLSYRYTLRAGHHLQGHGKCQAVHGEYWILDLELDNLEFAPYTAGCDMIFDFGQLKTVLDGCIGHWDHSFITDDEDLAHELGQMGTPAFIVPFRPTCENLVRLWASEIQSGFNSYARYNEVGEPRLLSLRLSESNEHNAVTYVCP